MLFRSVIGTFGEAPEPIQVVSSPGEVDSLQVSNPRRIAYLTQTTLSIDETAAIVERLKRRFPDIIGPPSQDICYATQNRQMAVKVMAPTVYAVLVVGAKNSSNSNRLVEVAQSVGVEAYLIENVAEIPHELPMGGKQIAVTAGASTPEVLVQQVLDRLKSVGFTRVQEFEWITEDVRFGLPPELKATAELSASNLRS